MSSHDVVIIGTGFSGLGMAMKLEAAGRRDYVIVEKADEVGGTWRDNTYPGCECDIPSHMYSFSYELNPHWSTGFSGQREIWDYLQGVADDKSLRDKVEFGVEVTGADWDEDRRRWTVNTTSGATYDARVVVAGVGGLHIPNVPVIEGAGTFDGPRFHSSSWQHDVDLAGKRVAVIGTGASAIQFIPIIAEQVADLTVFQRTPPWVLPKRNKPIPGWRKAAFERVPGAQRAYRNALYWALESRAVGFNGQFSAMLKVAQKLAKANIDKAVDDPALRAALTPDYALGCKRVLQSSTYYPTFNRESVHLETSGVASITPAGVVDRAGVLHEVDVIVYGTGFHVTDSFDYLSITGRDGTDLAKQFATQGIETYLGMMIHRFPNLFFLLGPNTALGHNSVVFMIEQQSKYVVAMLDALDAQGAVAAEPSRRAQDDYNEDIQSRVSKGVWTQGGCTSWYLDSQGRNRTIWPGFTFAYWWNTRRVETTDFDWDRSERTSTAAVS